MNLTKKESKIFEFIKSHPGSTKQQIIAAVWGERMYHKEECLKVHLSRIRGKLKCAKAGEILGGRTPDNYFLNSYHFVECANV